MKRSWECLVGQSTFCPFCACAVATALLCVELVGYWNSQVPWIFLYVMRCIIMCAWAHYFGSHRHSSNTSDLTNQVPSPSMAMRLIESRRSVFCRDMEPKSSLSFNYIQEILRAGNYAPSHGRSYPWHFVVFQEESSIDELKDISFSCILEMRGPDVLKKFEDEFDENVRWRRAKALIGIVMRRQTVLQCRNPEWEEIAACACAVQNMHLYVSSLPQIGAYWSSWYESARDHPKMKRFLGLSENDRLLGFFILGCTTNDRAPRRSHPPVSVDWR